MPHDNSHTENQRSEHARSAGTHAERSSKTLDTPFGEMGARGVNADLRRQKEMIDLVHDIGREWFDRATSEAELAFKLPNKFTSASSVPDAFSAYRDWLGEWMNMCGEDSRRLIADGWKIVDAGVRCFVDASPAMTSRDKVS